MAGFLDQNWFGNIGVWNRDLREMGLSPGKLYSGILGDNMPGANFFKGLDNQQRHWDNLYRNPDTGEYDPNVRAGVNLAALVAGSYAAAPYLAGSSSGGAAQSAAQGFGEGFFGEGVATGAEAAGASPWTQSYTGLSVLPGEGMGVNAGTGLAEPSKSGWFGKGMARGMRAMGNSMQGGGGSSGGSFNYIDTNEMLRKRAEEQRAYIMAQALLNSKKDKDQLVDEGYADGGY